MLDAGMQLTQETVDRSSMDPCAHSMTIFSIFLHLLLECIAESRLLYPPGPASAAKLPMHRPGYTAAVLSFCLCASTFLRHASAAVNFHVNVEEHPAKVVDRTAWDTIFNTEILKEDIAVVRDGIFSDAAIQELAREGAVLEVYARETRVKLGAFNTPTRHTWWFDFDHTEDHSEVHGGATCGIERAIEHMLRLDYPNIHERRRVSGAQWWVAIEKSTESSQAFDFNKDEGQYRGGYGLRCPMESTVTYLTGGGAPTVIINRTSPDGTAVDPLVPSRAAIIYPVPGRHVVFRANLQHGVMGTLSSKRLSSDLRLKYLGSSTSGRFYQGLTRYALHVNFWDIKPQEPDCQRLPQGALRRLTTMYEHHGNRPLHGKEHHQAGKTRRLKRVVFLPDTPVDKYIINLNFRSADELRFELPINFDREVLEAWDVIWEPRQVQGSWGRMNFTDPIFLKWWQQSYDMKILIFVDWIEEGEMYFKALRELLPALQPFIGKLKILLADTTKHEALLSIYKTDGREARRLNRQGDGIVVAVRGTTCCGAHWKTMAGHLTSENIAGFAREFIAEGEIASNRENDL